MEHARRWCAQSELGRQFRPPVEYRDLFTQRRRVGQFLVHQQCLLGNLVAFGFQSYAFAPLLDSAGDDDRQERDGNRLSPAHRLPALTLVAMAFR